MTSLRVANYVSSDGGASSGVVFLRIPSFVPRVHAQTQMKAHSAVELLAKTSIRLAKDNIPSLQDKISIGSPIHILGITSKPWLRQPVPARMATIMFKVL